jgi:hypothetical protein
MKRSFHATQGVNRLMLLMVLAHLFSCLPKNEMENEINDAILMIGPKYNPYFY